MERLQPPSDERVLRVVRGPDWNFLKDLVSVPDNVFYKQPTVKEIPRPPVDPNPDFDPPNVDALAA